MLWAVMAGGHNDGLAAGVAALAVFVLRPLTARRALVAGVLIGLATAIKLPFALFGVGLALISWRSPRVLASLAVGSAAVLIPSYIWAGRVALSAAMDVATITPEGYTPWYAAARVLHWQHEPARIDALGVLAFALLAAILMWRMPSGSRDFPAARLVLALALAWLITTPQQHPWYFAMVFPLLAVIPASRLDWILIADAGSAALGELPSFFHPSHLHSTWFSSIARICYAGVIPIALTVIGIVLLWLCITNDWGSAIDHHGPSWKPNFRNPMRRQFRGRGRHGLASDP
jgi:hypothetical protein